MLQIVLENLSERIPETGCWIWMGGCTSGGYGTYYIKNKPWYVHRLSYMWFIGPISKGLEIDHICRVRCCCNPNHLEAVTSAENTRRGKLYEVTAARHAITRARPVCKYGHPYTPENEYLRPDGRHECKICQIQQQRDRRAARRGRT